MRNCAPCSGFRFAEESRIVAGIQATLDSIAAADAEIDNRVLDLYGITDPADRQRILASAPVTEDADLEEDEPASILALSP